MPTHHKASLTPEQYKSLINLVDQGVRYERAMAALHAAISAPNPALFAARDILSEFKPVEGESNARQPHDATTTPFPSGPERGTPAGDPGQGH